jgi:hypothetical protein
MKHTALMTVAVSAAIATLISGCSSSKSKSTNTNGATSPATQAITSASAVTTSSSAAALGTGACKYVTVEQATELAGSPVKAGVGRSLTTPPITFKYCDYIFDPGNAPGVSVAVADLGGSGATLYQQFRTSKQGETDFQDVSGVGDEAFYSNGNLNIRKGNHGLILFVGRINSAPRGLDGIPDEKKLAEIILPQL